ncbi:hypothetical protein KEM54_005065 [Ascosphaera aggregata]|nr:hypothetical protein KEM54_005065 [Ascosphaera aggregata]
MQSLRALRPRLGLRAAQDGSSSLLRFSTPAVRHKHDVPALPAGENWCEKGIKDFMTADGFRFAWTEHQQWLVDNLNRLTEAQRNPLQFKIELKTKQKGTVYYDYIPKDIVIMTSRDPNQAQLFNFASMAHNNHFFFSCISDEPQTMDANFADIISESCSSVQSLKEEFLGIAEVMFGPGFVWLCKDITGSLKIVNTYNAGTPYSMAHTRRQSIDANTTRPEDLPVSASANPMHTNAHSDRNISVRPFLNNTSSTNFQERRPLVAPGGLPLQPLLCVNTWQIAWLPDYGLHAKRLYLDKWWDHIDWTQVVENYGNVAKRKSGPASYQM